MEITNELKQDLSTLESACGNFLEKYESVLTSALNKQEMSAEESLKIDLMLELITHLSSAQFAASYMQKDVVKEGILIQDPSGSFTLGGTPLPPMKTRFQTSWSSSSSWTYTSISVIGGSPKQRICGLKHPNLTSGIHARIRG